MSSMMKYLPTRSEKGEINVLVVPLILLVLFFIGAAIFALWAYTSREDYRTHAEQKIAAAVKVAKTEQSTEDTKAHAEADKQPLKTYIGPEPLGSVHVSYPKTWSGYVLDVSGNSSVLNAYFQPGVVPDVSSQTSTFALRVQVVNQSYASVVKQYTAAVTNKTASATAFTYPKVPGVVGIRYDGAINQGKKITGSMIVMPLRDKTLEVWTESPIYTSDFNNFIVPNLTFSP